MILNIIITITIEMMLFKNINCDLIHLNEYKNDINFKDFKYIMMKNPTMINEHMRLLFLYNNNYYRSRYNIVDEYIIPDLNDIILSYLDDGVYNWCIYCEFIFSLDIKVIYNPNGKHLVFPHGYICPICSKNHIYKLRYSRCIHDLNDHK